MAVASLGKSLGMGMRGVGPTDGGDMPMPNKGGSVMPGVGVTGGGGGGGGGSGSAQDGLGQIDSGAQTIRGAIGTAAQALGGGGGGNPQYAYKKGGGVVTTRMKPSMKRNDKCSNW